MPQPPPNHARAEANAASQKGRGERRDQPPHSVRTATGGKAQTHPPPGPRCNRYRAGRYSISRSSPTAPTGTNPALR
jgi:hypothetical protein